MIGDFAEEFWKRRAEATTASIRWTDQRMLETDVALVSSVAADGAALVDLGCGTGDIFLAMLDRLSRVTAVDMVADFLDRIPDDPKITKVVSGIPSFRTEERFDIGLLFGVVTHLSLEEENDVYRLLRALVPSGTVVVKNQCGREGDLDVDRWSDAFGARYVGRYPHVDRQAERLRAVFSSVDVVAYPDEVNRWPDSVHVAFVCR